MEPDVTPANPLARRDHLRICHIRAVEPSGEAADLRPVTSLLDLGRLAPDIEAAGPLAPRIAADSGTSEASFAGQRASTPRSVEWSRFELATPAEGHVDVRVASMPWESVVDAIHILEDFHYEQIHPDLGSLPDPTKPFHQLVFMPDDNEEPTFEEIQRLIYRADLEAIEEQSSIAHPEELNRRPGQLAAVGRFGTVMWGQQDYVESAALLSATMTVSGVATVADVCSLAHQQLEVLTSDARISRRSDTKDQQLIVRSIGVRLTFGAEAYASVEHLMPSLRVNSFHRAIMSASGLEAQASVVSRMVKSLDRLLDAANS